MTPAERTLALRAADPTNFTLRGVLVGLAIGTIVCFSNTYFGLQTGWVSGMAMPSALMGFAVMRAAQPLLVRLPEMLSPGRPFSPVENVLVQSVSASVGTMPLGCGFVGVVPALEYLLKKEEGGPLRVSLGKLIIWALGLCFFGVVFAVPLRREVIIREKLPFPTGTATALMIGVLHGEKAESGKVVDQRRRVGSEAGVGSISQEDVRESDERTEMVPRGLESGEEADDPEGDKQRDWKRNMKLLLTCFAGSAFYVCGHS